MKSKQAFLALGMTALPIAAATYRLFGHPSLKNYQHLCIRPGASRGADIAITFMGVTTMLFDDGRTRLLSDGYFSRPSKFPAFLGSIGPDRGRITLALDRAQIANLDAVFVAHSHFDHALDSPVVAKLTGAELIGSESTEQIARGYNFPMRRFRRVQGGDSLEYGDFKLTVFEAPHSPHPISPGEITKPVVPAANHSAFRLGRNFNFFIEHRGSAYLLQQSANYARGLYKNLRANFVFLGI